VKQETAGGLEIARDAVVPKAELVIPAENVLAQGELDKPAHEQVQAAVIVVVKPQRAGRPSGDLHPGRAGHVSKRPVAVVAVKNGPAVGGYKQVRVAVVVVVAHRRPHAERAAGHARPRGDVGKRAVPVVPVQGVPKRLSRLVEIARAAVDQVDVHPAVIVVVQKGATGTDRLGQVALLGPGVVMHPGDAAGGGGDFLKEGRRGPGQSTAPGQGKESSA
jgi:hypothetical protein